MFEMLPEFTTEALVLRGLDATTGFEIRRFFAAKLLRSRFQMDADLAWSLMRVLAMKHGFELLGMKRYDNILTSLRGYEVSGRTGGDSTDVWMRRKNLLRRMNLLEVAAFKRGMYLLMNTEDGSYVVDDELFSSCA